MSTYAIICVTAALGVAVAGSPMIAERRGDDMDEGTDRKFSSSPNSPAGFY